MGGALRDGDRAREGPAQPMSRPTISVVIPTRDGAATIGALVDAVRRQRVDAGVEIVLVDSGSTDDTIRRVRDRVDRVVEVNAREFNHGVTRNVGVAASAGDLVVLTVQDAEPVGDGWLAALVA